MVSYFKVRMMYSERYWRLSNGCVVDEQWDEHLDGIDDVDSEKYISGWKWMSDGCVVDEQWNEHLDGIDDVDSASHRARRNELLHKRQLERTHGIAYTS